QAPKSVALASLDGCATLPPLSHGGYIMSESKQGASPKSRNMKHKDFKPCALCCKGVMHAGHILFLRVTMYRIGFRRDAVQRAQGMELMMGGNALLANIMGPNEDLAECLDGRRDLLVCGACLDKHPVLYTLLLHEKDDEAA